LQVSGEAIVKYSILSCLAFLIAAAILFPLMFVLFSPYTTLKLLGKGKTKPGPCDCEQQLERIRKELEYLSEEVTLTTHVMVGTIVEAETQPIGKPTAWYQTRIRLSDGRERFFAGRPREEIPMGRKVQIDYRAAKLIRFWELDE